MMFLFYIYSECFMCANLFGVRLLVYHLGVRKF